MAKASKKTIKKAKMEMPLSTQDTTAAPTTIPKMNNKMITLALVVVVIGLLTYKLGPWLVPSIVGNTPLTRFELWSRLEKSYGTQALDDMVNEKILDKAIASSGIKVDQAKLDEQLKTLETQFESTGGLDEALKQRGLTRKNLEKQIRTQLAVEILLADKINPTEEEIKTQFDTGVATVYKDKKFDDVKASITEEIKQTKLRDAFLAWFADVKKDAKVKTFGL
jgi:hypothetical protein